MLNQHFRLWVWLVVCLVVGMHPAVEAAGTLSERNYKKLQVIHKLISQDKFNQAQKALNRVLAKKNDAYTEALFLQTSAQVAISQSQYPKAIKRLQRALSMKALPAFVEKNIVYNLAQLTVQQDDYRQGLKYLKRWLVLQKKRSPQQHIFAASVFGQQKQYKSAIKHVQRAIAGVKRPKESWYQLLISFYLDQKRYKKAIPIYHKLVRQYPKKRTYWQQLSGLYLQTKQKQQALAVLSLAYRQGMLTTESDLLRLVNLYLYVNNPYDAGTLLQRELTRKRIKSSAKNWRKLADSWILAREYGKGIVALKAAAALSVNDGALDVRIARLQIEQGHWRPAFDALGRGLKKGVKKVGEAHLLRGISAYYDHRLPQARRAFQQAMKTKSVRKRAKAWLQQME